jgi:hypothetical protein
MKLVITVVCQSCNKNDAQVYAVAQGAPLTPEWAWKICAKCSQQLAPDGNPGWVVIGDYAPATREL